MSLTEKISLGVVAAFILGLGLLAFKFLPPMHSGEKLVFWIFYGGLASLIIAFALGLIFGGLKWAFLAPLFTGFGELVLGLLIWWYSATVR